MNLERPGFEVKLCYHELKRNWIMEYNEAVTKVVAVIILRGNQYSAPVYVKLINLTFQQIAPESSSVEIINFFEHGKIEHEKFREERYVNKEKKLSSTIIRINFPTFLLKQSSHGDFPKNEITKRYLKNLPMLDVMLISEGHKILFYKMYCSMNYIRKTTCFMLT